MVKKRCMKQWNKINWPALNRRAREIEAELWRLSPAKHAIKEKSAAAPVAQLDYATIRALIVWCNDGGPAA